MTELKPCPFCGGKVTIASYGNYLSIIASGNEPNVSCGCRLFMESELFDENDILAKQREKEKLIEKWNKRPNPWHTGTPTEEGWYIIKLAVSDAYFTNYWEAEGKWRIAMNYNFYAWQKIEEKENGQI